MQIIMDNLIKNITSYLNFLNNDLKLNISIHFSYETLSILPDSIISLLLPYNTHTHPYCVKIKNTKHQKCILNQVNILEILKKDEYLINICHAGVYEYIYPICKNNTPVAFATASGYFEKADIPLKLLDSVLPPLCTMAEKLFILHAKETVSEYNKILLFLNEYHTNITLDTLSKHFNRSKSHISHLFKKKSGETIRAYCNNLKLEDAKKLLTSTNLSITEIAFNSGFCDTSYFIYLFKQKFGISPLKYRTKNAL